MNGLAGQSERSPIALSELRDPAPTISSSIPAEYARMLLSVHVVFCVLTRLTLLSAHLQLLAGICAGLWLLSRRFWFRAPTLSRVSLTGALTGSVLLTELLSSGSGTVSGLFGTGVLLILLALAAATDLAAWIRDREIPGRCRNWCITQFHAGQAGRWLVRAVVLAMATWALLVPAIEELLWLSSPPPDNPVLAMDRMTLLQSILFRFSEALSAVAAFTVGSCVGSFLNVVIYRVPLRLSVLLKPSHCPGCQQDIRGQDNLPLIGWLNLKGRCFQCQCPISGRYPTVELLIGLLFLLLYFVELISGGTNLPVRPPNQYAGVLWILFYTKWDLVGLYLFHNLLLCTLFSWTMIRRDRQQVPISSMALMLGLCLLIGVLQPHVLPWPGLSISSTNLQSAWQTALTTMGLGAAAAVAVCGLRSVLPRFPLPGPTESWLLVGTGFGWQTVVTVAGFCLLLSAIRRFLPPHVASHLVDSDRSDNDRSITTARPGFWLLPGVTLLVLCFWRQIAGVFWNV